MSFVDLRRMKLSPRIKTLLIGVSVAVLALVSTAHAATFVVTNTLDLRHTAAVTNLQRTARREPAA